MDRKIKQDVGLGLRISLSALFLIFILLFVSFIIEPNLLLTTYNDFDLFGGPSDSLKIVFISDIHVAYERPGHLEEVVREINELKPDLVLIGGDIIESSESELDMLSPLENLKASGVYAVLGNHDYGVWGCPANSDLSNKVEQKLESMNITVLRNENRILNIRGNQFALIGLDDDWVCRNDYKNANQSINPEMPKMILTHNQLSVDPAEVQGKSLIMSGHTHCGSVRLPFITQLVMGPGFGSNLGGRETIDNDTESYVTCGITGGGVRFMSNPEISVINVR